MSSGDRSVADAFRAAALRQRVITAVVIAAGFLVLVLVAHLFSFEIAVGIVFLVSAWEWAGLSGFVHWKQRLIYVALFLGVVITVQYLTHIAYVPLTIDVAALPDLAPTAVLMQAAVVFWLFALLAIITYPGSERIWGYRITRALLGPLLLLPAWAGVVLLKQQHPGGLLVLWVVAIIALADIGAYFAGITFGKHKLAPLVSPGKSWEGVAGGLLANVVFAGVLSFYLGLSAEEFFMLVIVHALVTVASVIGDLFESMVKRHQGVKDSGTLLPGHGGVLDRIDGWMAAVPVFTLAYLVSAMWN